MNSASVTPVPDTAAGTGPPVDTESNTVATATAGNETAQAAREGGRNVEGSMDEIAQAVGVLGASAARSKAQMKWKVAAEKTTFTHACGKMTLFDEDDQNVVHGEPKGFRAWMRLILGFEHNHDLAVHVRVHLAQDLLIMLFGGLFGWILFHILYATGWEKKTQKQATYLVCYFGILFLRMLKMIVIPLMFTAISTGVCALLALKKNRNAFRHVAIYVICTSITGVIIGQLLGWIFNPGGVRPSDYLMDKAYGGSYNSSIDKVHAGDKLTKLDQIMDTLDGFVPSNIVAAVADGNMIGLCVFSLIFGVAAFELEDDIVLRLMEHLNQLFIKMFPYKLQPYAVFLLLAKLVATNTKDFGNIFGALATFSLTVLLGLFLHCVVVLPTVYKTVTKRPFKPYIKAMEQPLFVAVATSSSAATMPYTLRSVAAAWPRVETARFTIPFCTQMNMDGTAIYQSIVVMYIAQVTGVPLSFWQSVGVVIATTVASMTTAAIPGGALMTVVFVLRMFAPVGYQDRWLDSIALVLPMDKFLDMIRTMVNVYSDTICTACVDHFQEGDDTATTVSGFGLKDFEHAEHAEHEHHEAVEKRNSAAAARTLSFMSGSPKTSAAGEAERASS